MRSTAPDRAMYHALVKKLDRLESARRSRATLEPSEQWATEFRFVPTCPPTTAVHVRAGIMGENTGYWFWIEYDVRIDEQTIDFATDWNEIADSIENPPTTWLKCNFANAGYYRAFVIGFNYDWVMEGREGGGDYGAGNGSIWLYNGGKTEHETAVEAEAEIDAMLNGGEQLLFWDRFPLAAIVLKNDGRTGVDGAVLPVDQINRGRSYLYRDVRPRNRITA